MATASALAVPVGSRVASPTTERGNRPETAPSMPPGRSPPATGHAGPLIRAAAATG